MNIILQETGNTKCPAGCMPAGHFVLEMYACMTALQAGFWESLCTDWKIRRMSCRDGEKMID